MRSFRIDIPDRVLDDLKDRIRRTRYSPSAESWGAGTDSDYLEELLEYWATGFDWRAQEHWLNSFPQYLANVDGQTIHFVHVRGAREPSSPAPIPVLLMHGWPYSFVEMLSLVPFLTDPAAHGGNPRDSFDVVIPSLPGYGYSSAPIGHWVKPLIADTFTRLMTEELKYTRFGTSGEDVGAGVSDWIAVRHPDSVLGIYASHPAYPPRDRRDGLSPDESAFLIWLDEKWRGGEGYAAIQSTRPDTLAAGLMDSPAGLAAWIVEKFRAWSDCGGDIERRFTKDEILATLTIYWATQTVRSSMQPYYDEHHEPPLPEVNVPAGVGVGLADKGMPRTLAERTYTDLRLWRELPRGGHFLAKEEPELVALNMREFFGSLRLG